MDKGKGFEMSILGINLLAEWKLKLLVTLATINGTVN